MFAYLAGTLAYKASTQIIVECNGVGYAVSVSLATSALLPLPGERVKVLTELIVREDSWTLYGFFEEKERSLFNLLIQVSGIGPKIALGILSATNPAEFAFAIQSSNIAALQKMPGIGKKTAERLLVEMKDKVDSFAESEAAGVTGSTATSFPVRTEAIAALQSLGYTRLVAEKAVREALQAEPNATMSVEKLVRKALQCAR